MAKRRKQEVEADGPLGESIFDHFAAVGRPLPNTPPKTVDTSELLAKIDALEKRLGNTQAEPQYPMLATGSPQQQQTRHATPADVKVDLKDMPDPATDLEAYNRELAQRVNAAVQAQTQAVGQQLSQQFEQRTATDRLWNGFREKHPEWAKFEPLVETVAKRVVSDADARGVDLQKYMFSNPDLFYQDLSKALDAGYGKLLAEGGDEDEDTDEGGDDNNRTMDLGGQPSANRARKAGGDPAKGAPSMLDDLGKVQRSMGIY